MNSLSTQPSASRVESFWSSSPSFHGSRAAEGQDKHVGRLEERADRTADGVAVPVAVEELDRRDRAAEAQHRERARPRPCPVVGPRPSARSSTAARWASPAAQHDDERAMERSRRRSPVFPPRRRGRAHRARARSPRRPRGTPASTGAPDQASARPPDPHATRVGADLVGVRAGREAGSGTCLPGPARAGRRARPRRHAAVRQRTKSCAMP